MALVRPMSRERTIRVQKLISCLIKSLIGPMAGHAVWADEFVENSSHQKLAEGKVQLGPKFGP